MTQFPFNRSLRRLLVALLALVTASACAATADTAPPAPPTTAGPWLTRLAAHAKKVHTLHADLVYDRIQGLVGDKQRRLGTLEYVAGPPARFAVHFDRLLVDVPGTKTKRVEKQDRWYIFDGRWLIERKDDEKQFTKYQVAPATPAQNAPPADPLTLGRGPFAVPLNLDKTTVEKRFAVTVVDDAAVAAHNGTKPDPQLAHTVHLHLTPKQGFRCQFTTIDLWYDRLTLNPVRAATDDESENQSIIDLKNVQVNGPVNPAVLNTSPPTGPGWTVQVVPLKEEAAHR